MSSIVVVAVFSLGGLYVGSGRSVLYALWVLARMYLCTSGLPRPRCFSLGPAWPPLVMPALLVIFECKYENFLFSHERFESFGDALMLLSGVFSDILGFKWRYLSGRVI